MYKIKFEKKIRHLNFGCDENVIKKIMTTNVLLSQHVNIQKNKKHVQYLFNIIFLIKLLLLVK